MRFVLALVATLLISSCASTSRILPPSDSKYFELSEDFFGITTAPGIYRDKMVLGLERGRYSLVGEDGAGYYYKGPGFCVYLLRFEDKDRFLLTHERSPTRNLTIGNMTYEGGLFVPKDPSQPAKIYWIFTTKPHEAAQTPYGASGAELGQQHAKTMGADGQLGVVGGMVGVAIANSLVEGGLKYSDASSAFADGRFIRIVDENSGSSFDYRPLSVNTGN